MKKLFIVSCFIFFTLYPPPQSEAKVENNSIKTSIKNFEKINRETLVDQFFMEYHELNERVIKVENHLKK